MILPHDGAFLGIVEFKCFGDCRNLGQDELHGKQRRVFNETAKPELSLIAQLNTKRIDEGFGKSFQMDKPDAVVGLQFSIPLENRTAKSKITKTNLQISQLKN